MCIVRRRVYPCTQYTLSPTIYTAWNFTAYGLRKTSLKTYIPAISFIVSVKYVFQIANNTLSAKLSQEEIQTSIKHISYNFPLKNKSIKKMEGI